MPDTTNPYDDILRAPDPATTLDPAANPYDDIVDGQALSQRAQMRASVSQAQDTNPDAVAAQRRLAQYVNLNPKVGEYVPDTVKRLAAMKEVEDNTAASPVLQRKYADVDFARLAYDDSGPLSLVETVLNSFKRGVPGLRQNLSATAMRANSAALENVASIEAKMLRGERVLDTEDPMAVRFMSAGDRAQLKADISAAAGGNASTIATAQATKNAIPQPAVVQQVMQAKGWGEAIHAFMTDPVRFIASVGPESMVQNAPGMVAAIPATLLGGPAAGSAVMGAGSFSTDFGSSLLEAIAHEGVDIGDSAALAAASKNVGLMRRAAAQAMAHASVVGTVDGLSAGAASRLALPGKLATKMGRAPVARELANMLVQTPVQGVMGGLGEAGGELAAGQPLDPGNILAEIVGEAFSAPAEVASIAGGRIRERMAQAREAEAAGEAIGQVTAAAAQSKLQQRDPQAFADYLGAAAADGPLESVFIDGRTLAQSDITGMPADLQQSIADAAAAGGDVQLPLSVAIGLAPELQQHMRMAPDAMTPAEAPTVQPDDELRAEVEQAIGRSEPTQPPPTIGESVRAAVMQQLEAIGRFTPDVNRAYSDLFMRFAGATAERFGLDANSLGALVPKIVSQLDLGRSATLDQRSAPHQTETPEFKAWFGGSKAVDADGKPLVLYHGTRDDIESFDVSRVKRRFSNSEGFYLTSLPGHASVYADGVQNATENFNPASRFTKPVADGANVMPVYASLHNPKIVDTAPGEFLESVVDGDGGAMVRQAKADGFDGVIVRRSRGDEFDGSLVVAFRPEQIKSAIGNNGAFDPNYPNILHQQVFHGSPHGFERFSMNHIGSGEGAQAYGHGLYFAEHRGVAANYFTALADNPGMRFMTLGSMRLSERNGFDYSARASESAVENLRASLAEDLMVNENELHAVGKGGFAEYVLKTLDEKIAGYVDTNQTEFVRAGKTLRKMLAAPGALSVDFHPVQGGVYSVDIPDEAMARMLSWDKPLNRQPAPVQAALANFAGASQVEIGAYDDALLAALRDDAAPATGQPPKNPTGEDAYHALARQLGSDKAASEALAAAGVPGIRYLDGTSRANGDGTHNVVVFDQGVIDQLNRQVSKALYQGRRGAFDPDTKTIALLAHADLSTFLHEAGHFFLEVQTELTAQPDAPAQTKADTQTLLHWFGVPDLAAWQALTLDEKRESHEKFARGFEAYLFEGKAPSEELAGLFQRFRSWLLNVYKSLTQLNVQLTPEVRQVFDRMLATDAEIANAEAQRNYRPLFDSAQAAGMTVDEWADYQRIGQQATDTAVEDLQRRSLKDMMWLSNAKGRALRAVQRDATAKRAVVEAEARAEVEAIPIYQAWQFLMNGKLPEGEALPDGAKPMKLATPVLHDMGVDPAKLPGGNRMLSSDPEVAVHPDVVAGIFGLSSGDELVKLLQTVDAPEVTVEALTDQRMLERYGDLATPAGLERAAEAAIHNDARTRFLQREVGQLDKAVGNKPLVTRAARAYAEGAIANKRIRDIRPALFAAAEGRAAKAASKAFKAGDTRTAAVAKRDQLLQHQLAKVASRALDEVDAAVRYLKSLDTEAARKAIDADYSEQIDAILEKFDLRTSVSNKAIDKRKSLASWIEAQRELGFDPTVDESLLADTQTRHYRDIKLEELRGVRDAVKNIEHLGRLKRKLLTVQDERSFDAMVEEAAGSINANATKTIRQQVETNLPRDRAGKLLTQYLVSHRKLSSLLRQMDGSRDGGTMWSLLTRGMNKAGDTEAAMRAKATEDLTTLFEPINAAKDLYTKKFIPAVNDSLTRAGRLAVALNWGNATNRQRVMDGDHWSQGQVQAILDTLGADDWHFVQGVWDYIDSYWPATASKEKRVSGIAPEKVEATPVHTKFGEFRGGYYPIKYDPDRSTRAGADSLAEAVKQSMQGLYTRATTRRGHTKERVATVTDRPVRKDLGAIFEHVEQVTHDLAWHEWLIDANRLLRAAPIDEAIRNHYGPDVLRTLSAALADIAAGDIPAQGAFEQGMRHLRTGVSVAAMGWSLVTAFQQPLGLTQSMVRVGPKWVGRGIARWLGDATRMENTVAWIHERSDFMRLRGQTQNRELAEIRNTVHDVGSWKLVPPAVQQSYFYFTEKMQMVADVPTWLGAFEKAQDAGHDDAKSIALADQAVIDSQSSGGTKDLAAIQRGSPTHKLFTMFYSAFSATYNLSAESIARTDFRKPADVGRLAVDFLLLYTVPALLGMALKDAMRGDGSDYDDPKKLAAKMAREQLNYVLSTLIGAREFGAAVSGAFGYSGPAGTRLFSDAAKLSKQAAQGEADKAALEAANSVGGVLFHYPALQVKRTGEGIQEWLQGHPSLRALLFGSAPNK